MKNFIFVFSLFAIFLTVNAVPFQLSKRTTTFKACPVEGVSQLTVGINPDPLVSGNPADFNVSGTLSHGLTAGITILRIAFADLFENPIGDHYSKIFDESFKAGNPLSIIVKSVLVPSLPSSYIIGVAVGDPTNDPNNPLKVYGCAFAVVGLTKSFDDSALFDINNRGMIVKIDEIFGSGREVEYFLDSIVRAPFEIDKRHKLKFVAGFIGANQEILEDSDCELVVSSVVG
ncbi:6516_t:CDS:2 [Dentiscutata heterogama]|uniref:6516_t:CDS:1 n=1 Tax=Dentiscutata heterogama TaxID=1316150 RepID=A0ACA9LEE6_9GLOM|nr:6516_t:CDS:2 [Dentiscutata heterogama]